MVKTGEQKMIYEASCGEGRLRVWGTAALCGKDIQITLLGGTAPHIGAVSLAVYEPERDSATVSTVTVYSHRDDTCTALCAKKFSSGLRCTACVSAGIHVDNASADDLQALLANAERCCDMLIGQVSQSIVK